jgi:hypothetical protein
VAIIGSRHSIKYYDHRKIGFSRIWAGVQNFVLVVQNCIKKSIKYCQGLLLLFKSGRAGDMDL